MRGGHLDSDGACRVNDDKREREKKGRQRREETLSGKAVLSLKLSGPERERAALAKR